MDVQLFVPCFVDQLYPDTATNAVKLLENHGCTVHFNKNITCCGQPAYNSGYMADAEKVSAKCVRDIQANPDMPVVVIGGSCTGYMRQHLPSVIGKSSEDTWGQQSIYEMTEFLLDVLKIDTVNSSFAGKVSIHDACGALRECGIKDQVRTLLGKVPGVEILEMKEAETCCGFGGTFAVKFEPISIGMAETKTSSFEDTGAEYLVSTDWSCLMHLSGYIENRNLDIKVIHLIDLLAS